MLDQAAAAAQEVTRIGISGTIIIPVVIMSAIVTGFFRLAELFIVKGIEKHKADKEKKEEDGKPKNGRKTDTQDLSPLYSLIRKEGSRISAHDSDLRMHDYRINEVCKNVGELKDEFKALDKNVGDKIDGIRTDIINAIATASAIKK